MSSFDEWERFRTEVRINSIKSMTLIDSMAKIEDEFMSWAETKRVSELLQRRLLVQFRLYEKQLQEVVDKHRAEFDKAAQSANYDHMCIRFLERDFREIIKQYRFQRSQAGLPLLIDEDSHQTMESMVNMMRDDQTYMKYNSKIFGQAFYKNMDEVVTSVNTSQTALETNLVNQFEESHQHFASEMALVKLQLAELVNHLKEISDAKKGESESSKKRRLL
ncbi:hypothetical protein F511_21101 [Dorcoceras hygrometricum]|uniref:Uncharacterized protein n=1 Tax=Dorcoceras hygrometricum TaxID=472368 RepID=A0A2Z7CKR2_9LAMI|nr:hypothetical protein F511_21101 [Dorcoceras hygrometricum]